MELRFTLALLLPSRPSGGIPMLFAFADDFVNCKKLNGDQTANDRYRNSNIHTLDP